MSVANNAYFTATVSVIVICDNVHFRLAHAAGIHVSNILCSIRGQGRCECGECGECIPCPDDEDDESEEGDGGTNGDGTDGEGVAGGDGGTAVPYVRAVFNKTRSELTATV